MFIHFLSSCITRTNGQESQTEGTENLEGCWEDWYYHGLYHFEGFLSLFLKRIKEICRLKAA